MNAFLADRKPALGQAQAGDLLATMKTNAEQRGAGARQPRGMGNRFTGQQPQFLGPRWNR